MDAHRWGVRSPSLSLRRLQKAVNELEPFVCVCVCTGVCVRLCVTVCVRLHACADVSAHAGRLDAQALLSPSGKRSNHHGARVCGSHPAPPGRSCRRLVCVGPILPHSAASAVASCASCSLPPCSAAGTWYALPACAAARPHLARSSRRWRELDSGAVRLTRLAMDPLALCRG